MGCGSMNFAARTWRSAADFTHIKRYHFTVELSHLWHVLNDSIFLWVQSLPLHLLMRDTELCAWLEVLLSLWNSWFINKGVPLKEWIETRKCSAVSNTESSVLCEQSSWSQQPEFGGPEALAIKKEEKEAERESKIFKLQKGHLKMVFLEETVSRSLWIGGATRSSWNQACSFCHVVVQFNEQKFGFAARKWLKPGFLPGSPLQTCIFPYAESVCVMLRLILLALKCFLNATDTLFNFDNFDEFFLRNLTVTLVRMLAEPGSHPGDDVWHAQSYQRCLFWHNLTVLCAGCNHTFKYIVALCVQGKSLDLALSRHFIFKGIKALTVLMYSMYNSMCNNI